VNKKQRIAVFITCLLIGATAFAAAGAQRWLYGFVCLVAWGVGFFVFFGGKKEEPKP
jgi:hypothetical protein